MIIIEDLKNGIKLSNYEINWYSQFTGSNINNDLEISTEQIINSINDKGYYDEYLKVSYDDYKELEPIGYIKLEKKIPLPMVNEPNEYIYLLINKTKIFICVSFSHPTLWYEIDDNYICEEVNTFINKIVRLYNPIEYKTDFTNNVTAFVGTETMLNMNYRDFIENIIMCEWSELFLWGPMWKDHPFRETILNSKLSEFQYSKINVYSTQQPYPDKFIINVRSQISKSIITYELYDGLFLVYVQYDGLKNETINELNKLTNKKYPLDLPIDVIQNIIEFPYATHSSILTLEPLTINNFIVANILANSDKIKNKEILIELENIIDKNNHENNIMDVAKQTYELIYINVALDDFISSSECNNLTDVKKINTLFVKKIKHNKKINLTKELLKNINGIISNIFEQNDSSITSTSM
jgi:hypothetical protein